MPVLDSRTRLRREIEDLAIGDSVLTEHGLWVRRVGNTRFEVLHGRQKVVVGGAKFHRHPSHALLYEVADAALNFDELRQVARR